MTKPKAEHEKVGQGAGGGAKKVKLTDEELIKVQAWASTVSNMGKIADLLDISRTTFYEIRKRQPEVSEHYNKGCTFAETKAAKTFLERGMDGESWALKWYLENKCGWRSKKEEPVTNINISGVEYQIPSNNKKKHKENDDD